MRNAIYITVLLAGLFFQPNVSVGLDQLTQNKVWLFDAADNSGAGIKITEGNYGVSTVYFRTAKNQNWEASKILSIDTNQEYIKVKSLAGPVYELFVDWKDEKVIRVDKDENEVAYWRQQP